MPWQYKGVWAISLLFAGVCYVAYELFTPPHGTLPSGGRSMFGKLPDAEQP
jgi:hypothetical protein